MAEIIITSHHTVKPSSPTPLASKNHKLSFFDQIAPPIYIPLIFFYKNDESNSMQHDEISRRLKQSLSEILTIFYPLAGTINLQNLVVDCNDRGAEFVEARVHAHLQEFIENPKMEELKKLLPTDSSSYNGDNAAEMLVKTSFFNCGGFSIGICLSHKMGDAASAVAFMNAWADTCRNGEASGMIHPSFDVALHFPPKNLQPMSSGLKEEKHIVTKRLVFDGEKVEKLKREAASDEITDPSRAEAVSAFIWRTLIEANKGKTTSLFTATHVVNMRQRALLHPIPDHTFGNCVTLVTAMISAEEVEGERKSGVLVSKLRGAIRAVDDHFIKNIVINNYGDTNLFKELIDVYEAGNVMSFSSWLRFPVYEVDFGWGKPVRVCTATMRYTNLVILMDTPSGDGVEAWINVRDEHHQRFFQLLQANYNNLT